VRDYGKVFSRIWESADFRALSDDGRMLVMYLLTCQHGTISGCFRVPDGYACEDMGWDAERVSKGFANLAEKGFATRCESTKWVWIVKFLQWNQPENPNQRKAAVKQAQGVPENCSWRCEFLRICGPSLGLEQNPSLTVVEGLPNQKQKQEQKQEQENPSGSSADKLPPCPHREILALFAKHLPTLPQPKPELWSGARAKHLAARWKWLLTATKRGGERYATTEAEALAWLERFFGYVAGSDFLTGRTGKFTGCDLGWLMNEENFAKVVQGNYENKAAA
jgi:hypothetical protein